MTFNLDFRRWPQDIFIFSYSRLHAENQLPTFVISGDNYEEDILFLENGLKKTFSSINIFYLSQNRLHAKNQPLLFLEIAMKKTYNLDFEDDLMKFYLS